jgi:hypothetical protein
MNTIYDFNNLQNEEMLWTEVSNAIQDIEKGITDYMIKEFFKGKLNKDEAIFGFLSVVALKIADTYIPVNQHQIPSEKTKPIIQNQGQYKSRRTPRQKQRLFTLKNIFALKGN